LDKRTIEVILAEYRELKNEISQRSAFKTQMVYLTAVTLASLVTVWGITGSAMPIFVCPILTAFFALRWKSHQRRIMRIGVYIRKNIGKRLPDLG